jgi:hypothetical protein
VAERLGGSKMFSPLSTPWLPLVIAPFGLVLYVAFLLGVLWLATRVVRHAWYWKPSKPSLEDSEG